MRQRPSILLPDPDTGTVVGVIVLAALLVAGAIIVVLVLAVARWAGGL